MTPRDPLPVASIGGFGHAVLVFDEMLPRPDLARLQSLAPAFAGESLAAFSSHPLVERDRPDFLPSAQEALAALPPEVVIVSTEPGRIAGQVAAALHAGGHVIAEKPLAGNDADLARVHQAWRESGRGLMPMLNMRSLPAFAAAQRACREGAIGDVVAANVRKSYQWGARRPDWFSDRDRYGGTFPWVGIHALDIVHFITGQDFTEVSALHANLGHPDRPGCEDVCVAILRLANGALATVSVDYFRPHGASTHGDDWCRIVGTRGILEANASQGWCRLETGSGAAPIELPLEPPRMLFAEFLEAVRAGNVPTEPARIGLHLTDACLAARDSADTGQRRSIDPARWR